MTTQDSAGESTLLPLDQARHDAIDAAAAAVLAAVRPANTTRAFEQDWDRWVEYCAVEQMSPATVSGSLLVGFVTWLAHGTDDRPAQAPATIERRLAGVLDGWHKLGLVVPAKISSDARAVIRGYAKHLAQTNTPSGRGKAPALTIRQLRLISEALPQTPAGIRDRAIILIGFGIASRRSEIAHLLVEDIEECKEGLSVRVRDSKTGFRNPAVPRGTHDTTCPVRAWRAWLAASGITTGPAFRGITRHGQLLARALTPESIGRIITAAGERVGLDVHLTGHSLRSGLATEARRAGHDATTIAKQGGWRENSAQLYGYMQVVDRWSDNALKGIGL